VGALFTVLGSAAFADQLVSFATGGYASGLRTPEMMHKIDANGDGKVSKEEWQSYNEKLFAMMDVDKSSALEAREFMHPPKEVVSFATGGFANALRTQEMLTKLDVDHDGKVSREEFLEYQSKVFDMMDTGKTRVLGQNEFFGRGPVNR
jgi:Ca2+-binding EF-hand superfamily protein